MELLIVLALLWLLPMLLVWKIAESRNRSGHYVWWAVVLGWVGAIIAMVVILVQAEKEPTAAQVDTSRRDAEESQLAGDRERRESRLARDRELRQTQGSAGSRWVRHYLSDCAVCTRDGPACPAGRDLWAQAS